MSTTNGDDDVLKTEDDLKNWLVRPAEQGGRGVDESTLGNGYKTLYTNGFHFKSTLLGISLEALRDFNNGLSDRNHKLSIPLMLQLVNKLQKQQAAQIGKEHIFRIRS